VEGFTDTERKGLWGDHKEGSAEAISGVAMWQCQDDKKIVALCAKLWTRVSTRIHTARSREVERWQELSSLYEDSELKAHNLTEPITTISTANSQLHRYGNKSYYL
jgi:hypothetical protein